MKRNNKIKLSLFLTAVFILSMGIIAFATTYTSSVQVSYNSYLSGADRSYSGTHYALGMKVNSIDFDDSSTTPLFLVVHNSYFLGIQTDCETLTSMRQNIQVGYTYMWEFPNSIGSGVRAFDFNTRGGVDGFTANPVTMQSY